MEISGEMAGWQEIRNAKAFLARIAAQKAKLWSGLCHSFDKDGAKIADSGNTFNHG